MRQRFSAQREAVKEYLTSTTEHPTAETVYENVRRTLSDISLGTVYRNLSELVAEGEIIRLDTKEGKVRFDAAVKPHAHFSCSCCGQVTDIRQMDTFCSGLAAQAEAAGNIVKDYIVTFYGICRKCKDSSSV